MIHLYVGTGKGKTTCSMGLVARHASYNKKVLIAQFLKDYTSGEISYFEKDQNIVILKQYPVEGFFPFFKKEEQDLISVKMNEQYQIVKNTYMNYSLLILDEIIDAINLDIIDQADFLSFLNLIPDDIDVVLTGRNPDPLFIEISDYFTEFVQVKHPYQKGVPARQSIEY